MKLHWIQMFACLSLLTVIAPVCEASQPLETESARLLKHGGVLIAGGFERQRSSAGTEAATPFAFEYGITDRLELTVEPVAYSSIHDRGIRSQTGPGDMEITLTRLLAPELQGRPAFALAGEVKLPTARNTRIGTGKADYAAFAIASKRVGAWDTHANLGYTVIGRPQGATVNNVMSFALAEEFHRRARIDVVAEVFGSTAAAKEGGEGAGLAAGGVLTPELSGGELVGALGMRFHPARAWTLSLGLSVDNQRAVLVHPGVALKW